MAYSKATQPKKSPSFYSLDKTEIPLLTSLLLFLSFKHGNYVSNIKFLADLKSTARYQNVKSRARGCILL